MRKTTIAASAGELETYSVKEFYEPQGVRELNKAILDAPRYNASLTVNHYMDCSSTWYTQFTVGNTVPMDRFMSTASSSDNEYQESTLIRIELPKDLSALVVKTNQTKYSDEEHQVILPSTLDKTGSSLTYTSLHKLLSGTTDLMKSLTESVILSPRLC
jgi:hypothetical protein